MARILDLTPKRFGYAADLLRQADHEVLTETPEGAAVDLVLAATSGPDADPALRSGYPDAALVVVTDVEPEICAAARSGLMSLTGQPKGPPFLLGGHVMDAAVATFLALAALAELADGQPSGRTVLLSQLDCLQSLSEQAVLDIAAHDRVPARVGHRGAVTAVSGVLPCRDGMAMISVPATRDAWIRFAHWVGSPALDPLGSFQDEAARRADQDAIFEVLEGWSSTLTARELIEGALGLGIPASPVCSAGDLLEDEQLESRGFLRHDHTAGWRLNGALATSRQQPLLRNTEPTLVSHRPGGSS
jgi:crotonobetainyl-CoA:carnitine CoA-transferase CaiB-like acyl-CoA transferase